MHSIIDESHRSSALTKSRLDQNRTPGGRSSIHEDANIIISHNAGTQSLDMNLNITPPMDDLPIVTFQKQYLPKMLNGQPLTRNIGQKSARTSGFHNHHHSRNRNKHVTDRKEREIRLSQDKYAS